jgi:Tfp pilus assembly protein PilX
MMMLKSFGHASTAQHRDQRGAALIMALAILMILTVIGITVMNVSGLEARMAGNSQESTRALQLAESAIQQVVAQPTMVNNLGTIGASTPKSYTSTGGRTDVTVTFVAKATPPGRATDPRNIDSAIGGAKAHFEIDSRSQTLLGGKTEVIQGMSKDIPR